MNNNICIDIFKRINKKIVGKSKNSAIMRHSLEKGLANEEIVRQTFSEFLPDKYGVAKGKVINAEGNMSRQCDMIIFDKLNCPTLFIDDNRNQILPIEGVYYVLEIKTTLTNKLLKDSFECLSSVRGLIDKRTNKSTNSHVYFRPPGLGVIALSYRGALTKLSEYYLELSKQYTVSESFDSYSRKSPAFKRVKKQTYLVSNIIVVNKGHVHHMLDATVKSRQYNEYSFGVFLTGLLTELNQINLECVKPLGYFNWVIAEQELGIFNKTLEQLIANKSLE